MSDKIRSAQLAKTAYVYIRQSTLHQVRFHRESQRRQYELEARARQLGFRDVLVIDDDLGRSGSGFQERPGFARLLAAVCEARAGAVFSLEASRLARNNREWHHLIDLCGLTETLVIDHDGVYDPRLLNDRLLLGLKGTMSEFELGLFRQRAHEALRQMVLRGEVLKQVPIGYVRTRDNRCEMLADRQVQEGIRGVFAKFRELGSLRQVFLWYVHEQLPLPRHCLARDDGIAWEIPTYARLQALLKNPIYAGAFVSGRRCTTTIMIEGHPRKRSKSLPLDQWPVLIREHHQGYITWVEFAHNQELLRMNCGKYSSLSPGAAKHGSGLLAGLLRCRRCARKLVVLYCGGAGARVARYHCRSNETRSGSVPCVAFAGPRVEQAVVEEVLRALRPLAVEASLEAHDRLLLVESEKQRALSLAVEKARYEVEHARRQYDAVDPANRLVAAELETRWNEALTRLREAESRLQQTVASHSPPSQVERERLLKLGKDLETLWSHPDASMALRKRILRTVLTEIVVDLNNEPREVLLWLHWAGGAHTQLRVHRVRKGQHRQTTDQTAVDLVTQLAKICKDDDIAAALNRLGLKTGKGNSWTRALVTSLRSKRGIPVFDPTIPRSWLNQLEARRELGLSWRWIDRLLRTGILPGHQVVPRTPWIIERHDLQLPAVRAAVESIRKHHKLPSTLTPQNVLPFKSTT